MNAPTYDRDTGLAAMVAAARPGDHGVLADWVEDYLRDDDLAAVLRAGIDDPRKAEEGEWGVFQEFRYRQLDRLVLFTMTTYRTGVRAHQDSCGFVVCLCTHPEAPGGRRRWRRWFPETTDEPALGRLWADLGKDVPG